MIDYVVKGKTVTSKYYTKLLKKVDVKVVKTDPETEFIYFHGQRTTVYWRRENRGI